VEKQPVIVLCCVCFALASAKEIPELKLTNGKVFRNITIMRYDAATVTLKSEAGTGPIPYSMIPEPYRAQMMKIRDEYAALERAVLKRELMVGMTKAQVLRAWGSPARRLDRGIGEGSTAQWVYEQGGGKTFHALFDGDRLRSWTKI
jgi:hypothetical protein